MIKHFFKVNLLAIFGFYLLIAGLFYFRASYIDRVFGNLVGCDGCFYGDLFIHDAFFLAALSIAYLVSFCIKRLFIVLLVRAVIFLAIILYLVDVLVMQNFFVRFNVSHIKIYADDLGLVWRYMESAGWFAGSWWVWGLGVSGLLFLFMWRGVESPASPRLTIPLALSVVCMAGGVIAQPNVYVHDWALRNFLLNNIHVGEKKAYSQAYQNELFSRLPNAETCEPGREGQRDLVLLILESWSPYQSRLWRGQQDWTPRLDELATKNIYFTNFYAAGFTTNEGLMALLTGMEFLSPVKSFFAITPFEGAWGGENLAALKEAHGYHTAFLTSGNLKFSKKEDWLKHLGFAFWEGHDYPGYKGISRSHFDSVPDDELYQRSLEYLRQQKAKVDQPVFLVVESVSTHHPYIHPYTKVRSEEAAFRYMDQAAYDFYQGLVDQDFFEQGGRLLIVSDHRAMIPVSRYELETYGRSAVSLIPAMLVSKDSAQGAVDSLLHQADLLYSLKKDLQQQVCANRPRRDIYDPQSLVSRSCVFHARGDRRDRIDVFCDAGEGTVALSGDATHFIDAEGLSADEQQQILDQINWLRLEADRSQESWLSQ